MRARALGCVLAFLSLLSSSLAAQDPGAGSDPRKAADAAFAARDYAAAGAQYAALAKEHGGVHVYYRLGYCLHAQGKLDEALAWHERAAALGKEDARLAATATYNVACVHALQGRPKEALAALQLAIERGFRNAGAIANDEDLASLRKEPEFARLLAQLETAAKLVVVVVHEGVEMLDFAGPVEVFAAARGDGGEPAFRVKLVGPTKDPIRPGAMTAAITPDYAIADCPQPAVLVIPGGATNVLVKDRAFMEFVRAKAPQCEVVLSVCTGAFVLAELGLLDGKQATTHHSALPGLRKRFPKVVVVDDRKFVDTGLCVTAAGVSSGIEGALHVVGRLCSPAVAENVAKYMEYSPQVERKPQ